MITDEEIRQLQSAIASRKRKNAHDRACLKDCAAALSGDRTCRDVVENVWIARARWRGRTPSRIGIVLVFLLGAAAGAVSLSSAQAGAEDSLRDIARSLEGIRDELRSIRREGVHLRHD